MRKNICLILAHDMLLTAAASFAGVALAADAETSPEPTTSLETVVVTAERRSESLQEVPLSVTAISGDTLQSFGDEHFADYARTIPNLSFNTGGSDFGVTNGRDVTIRGIVGGQYRKGRATTSFYIDDTPVPVSLDPQVLDMERVEVLRGPQGTLYGSSAMGGTVRLITRQADAQQTSGSIDLQGFDINHGGAGYDVSGILNVPIVTNELALKASAYNSYKPGIFTREYGIATSPGYTVPASQPVGEDTHVGSDTESGGMLKLAYTPSFLPGLTVTPMSIYQSSRGNGLPLADYNPSNLIQIRPLNVGESYSDNWSFNAITAKFAPEFGAFIASTAWFHRVSFDNEDGTEAVATVFGSSALPPLSETLATTYLASPTPSWVYLTTFTEELRFESAFKGPFQLVAGAYYDYSSSSTVQREYTPYDSTGAPFFWEQVPHDGKEVAGFADVTYTPIHPIELSAGAREAQLSYTHAYIANGWGNGGPSDDFTYHEEHALTPRFTASYKITDDAMLYTSAAKGYRIGGANSPPPPLCASEAPANAESYNSDSLWSYELGSKNTLLDGRLKTRAAVYRINWNDFQQTVVLPICDFAIIENAGAATSTGAEFEADLSPVRDLLFNVAAGYDDAKITSVPAGAANFVVGQPLSGVPKWNASLLGDYSMPTSIGASFVRAQYSFNGRSISYNNDPLGRIRDPYSLLDLRAGISSGPLELSLFIKNVFDVRANLGDEEPETAELAGRPRWMIAQPRTIGIEIRRAFKAL